MTKCDTENNLIFLDCFTGEFEEKTIDFYYDDYFRGEEIRNDWTDDQIAGATNQNDIERCLGKMRRVLYRHFGVSEKGGE